MYSFHSTNYHPADRAQLLYTAVAAAATFMFLFSQLTVPWLFIGYVKSPKHLGLEQNFCRSDNDFILLNVILSTLYHCISDKDG